ncbi:MAG: TonB-dependent receptor [Acidobacteria bacterium]|nr:TonB-dependent receptor [Acidobacteriota bacterium]
MFLFSQGHTRRLFWGLLLSAYALTAQVPTAVLTGVVKDSTGAVVPNVKVTATNTGTNLARSVVTDESGNFRIAPLNPGPYRVDAEASGFKKATVPQVILEVGQQARIDVDLQVGDVTQTMEVTGRPSLVNTESGLIGGVINQSRVLSLPLNGRNFMELTTLTAGIAEGTGSAAIVNKRAPTAAGMPHQDNNYQLDGADNKEAFFNSWNLGPSVDAIQEFSIQVGQYSAEFGSGGGAVINVVTKSGTNALHGTLWEFMRNNVFDARNYFLTPTQTIAPLRRNQFGAAIGGPIIKNKMFLFGNYDATRIRSGSFRTGMVPTSTQLGGNFNGYSKAIRDIRTDPVVPFPNNIIPASRLDPISQALAKYYASPNNPNPAQNFSINASSSNTVDSGLFRYDWRMTDKHDLMVRYGIQNIDSYTPGTFPSVGGLIVPQKPQNLAVNVTSIVTSKLLNEFRVSYGRQIHRQRGQNSGNPIAANAGVPFAPKEGSGAGFVEGLGMSNTIFSALSEQQPWFLTVNSFQWYDGITWSQGKHNIKAGFDIRRHRADAFLGTRLNNSYTFTGQFSGDGFTDFLLGDIASSSVALSPNETGRFRRTILAGYVLDDWKVSPKLTLNVGLRYEYGQVPVEIGGLTPSFDPTLANGQGGLRFPKQNKNAEPFYRGVRPDLGFGYLDRETLFNSDKNNIAPRFGFAYRPMSGNRTVIRGGYGVFFSGPQLMNLVQNSVTGPPAQLWAGYTSALTRPTLTWAGDISNPNGSLATAIFGLLTGPENNWIDGYTQQWSLSVSQELSKTMVLEVQYLGSKGTHLENALDYNAVQPGAGALQQRLPFPKWNRVYGFNSSGAANYNALLVTAEKRMGKGLMFKGAYTWSKTLTKNGARSAGNVGQVQNPFDLRQNDGFSSDNIPHRFTGNFLYELPFGRGKALGSNLNKAVDFVLGGWTVSGIVTLHNGYHVASNIAAGNCNSSAQNLCRPDLIGDPLLGGNGLVTPRWNRDAFDWPLNTAKHPAQAPRFGSAITNLLRGNSVNSMDAGIFKNFVIKEHYRFEFRTEMFNALNHTNFATPNASVENPNFGRTFSTSIGPRTIQFGLKFYW